MLKGILRGRELVSMSAPAHWGGFLSQATALQTPAVTVRGQHRAWHRSSNVLSFLLRLSLRGHLDHSPAAIQSNETAE